MNTESLHEPFWRRQFPQPVEPVFLPWDHARPPVPAYRRDICEVTLATTTNAELHRLSAKLNCPVLAILAVALNSVLFRYSGQERIVVGVASSVTEETGALPQMACPLLPLQTVSYAEGDKTGSDLFDDSTRTLCEAMEHAAYPLGELQSWAGCPNASTGPRLFNTALCMADSDNVAVTGWPMSDPEIGEFLAQCDVVVIAVATVSGLTLQGDFDADLFEPATVQRFLSHIATVLEAMITDPSLPVMRLPILTATEQRELVGGWNINDVASSSCMTLHEQFEAQVEERPDAVALTCDGQSLTYYQLNQRANRLAHALRNHGVGPDTLVAIYLERSLELVIGLIAILKAGGAYLPIDVAYPKERLGFMLEDAQAPILLTQSQFIGNLPSHQAQVLCVDDVEHSAFQSEPTDNPSVSATPDNLAYVIYTSGTTGNSKGALITHRNVTRLFRQTQHWYGFTERDVWTLFHSTAFDFSVWEIWGALLYGGRLVIVPFMVSRSPEAFYTLLHTEQVTVLNQTPSAFRQLIQAERAVGLKQLALRYVIFGGEALDLQSLRPWFERHGDQTPQLVNMYGITETTVHVTYRPLSKHDLDSGSLIGTPIPDLQIFILDSHRQLVPIGIPGEIYVGGDGLARGYLRRPELTAERFVFDHLTGRPGARLYRTGDLARFLPGRDIEYLGRIDHQVKIRGFRIELGEIESALSQQCAVREVVVLAREDVPGTKILAAYVVATFPPPEVSVLREYLKRKLPDYMVPAAFVFLDKLPLTNNGKVDRKALPAPEQNRRELTGRYVAPRTSREERLATIWSKVLRLERVGIHDNFFELGGDSILSIQVISTARQAGLGLTPKLMFTYQTIAELADVVEEEANSAVTQEVVAGDVPLTPIQHWFFEQNLEDSHHYNQAYLFEVLEQLDRSLLIRAVKELSQHHDALRLRYVREAGGWRQFYVTDEAVSPLVWTDLVGLTPVEQLRTVEISAISMQSSLDLEGGPIWRVVYFNLGMNRPARMLFLIHHLAVDGISWRVLLEDLETVYQQLKASELIQLSRKTTSYQTWAKKLLGFGSQESLLPEVAYWEEVTQPQYKVETDKALGISGPFYEDTEGAAATVTVLLSVDDTHALLHKVPPVYNTQINDVLLTALVLAWGQWSGSRVLYTNLEGHGRENLFEDVDLSRTVGWFTSIFPVRLELPSAETHNSFGEALKSIKEQLRRVPQHGIGYGVLRYLTRHALLLGCSEPTMVFNYFGQFDQVLAGSKLFRFASESSGAWHGQKQRRRHVLEVNSLVMNGRLEVAWTFCAGLHSETAIRELADSFLTSLKGLITHCQMPEAGGYTPTDFPLLRLDQASLDQLVAGRCDIEDIYPLSPIQGLFFSTNPQAALSSFDQWRCTLNGTLNVSAFQLAWLETVRRHSILRTTIHGDLAEPLQMVHRDVQLPWAIEDWRTLPANQQDDQWFSFQQEDRARPLILTDVPVMRFSLVRLAERTWNFMWSVPAILLDGWSWPMVFRDVSEFYEAFCGELAPQLEPVRPYRDYLGWLARQSSDDAHTFWRNSLAGFYEPTSMPSEPPAQDTCDSEYAEHVVQLSADTTTTLQSIARNLQITLNTLVQVAWTLILNRQTRKADVVFGAAFSGRPTDLTGAESIVGPFVNNLPVRVKVNPTVTTAELLRTLHRQLLEMSSFQFTPLMEIQRVSEVPWQHRLFESLIVFQNYQVDEAARRLGSHIEITDFTGPIHTKYPILLLAEPGTTLHLTLIYDRQKVARTAVDQWGGDLRVLMEQMPKFLQRDIGEFQSLLSSPAAAQARSRKLIYAESQNYVPPQTELEKAIADVWQRLFGVDRVSINDNLFDLGGHSLLLLQMHNRLRDTLKIEFPIVALFTHSTIRKLASHLGQPASASRQNTEQWRGRAQLQKDALARLRTKQRTTQQ